MQKQLEMFALWKMLQSRLCHNYIHGLSNLIHNYADGVKMVWTHMNFLFAVSENNNYTYVFLKIKKKFFNVYV